MAQTQQPTQGPINIDDAISDFALQFYRILSNNNADENMFLSPYSVSAALMLQMLGCSGESESQLRRGLCLSNLSSSNVHEEYRKMHNSLIQKSGETVTLSTANRVFAAAGIKLLESYKSDSLNYYGSETELLDFVGDTEGSRELINTWVEQQTNNKIKDLFPAGSLGPNSVVVLTNAIYFKGEWETKFDASWTKKGEFYLSKTKSEITDMMHMRKKYLSLGISDKWDCKIIQLPYKGARISMLVILPNEIDGLRKLEASLSIDTLTEMRSQICGYLVNLTLPKFKMESIFGLEKELPKMGITDCFTPKKGDFARMMADQPFDIAVSKFNHKALVEVKELGTEAAAGSGRRVIRRSSHWPPPVDFNANHPFLFLIQENEKGTILFIGRYTQPTEQSPEQTPEQPPEPVPSTFQTPTKPDPIAGQHSTSKNREDIKVSKKMHRPWRSI